MCNALVSIRDGVISDAEIVCAIRVKTWQKAYVEFMPESFLAHLDPSSQLKRLQQLIKERPNYFSLLIAELENKIIGFCISGTPRYSHQSNVIELQGLYVLPKYWGKGAGNQLIKQCIKEASEKEYKYIELWCIKGNRQAQRTYENSGFVQTGVERSSSALTQSPLTEIQFRRELAIN
ncbi:MAG: GNAT family N-acetyltransferase [Cellvibrionaceae bacterium]